MGSTFCYVVSRMDLGMCFSDLTSPISRCVQNKWRILWMTKQIMKLIRNYLKPQML